MSNKICLAQSIDELKFILSEVKESIICVPLSLHTQLYCMQNKLEFYNPLNFIENNFYHNALKDSENLINKLNLGDLTHESHIKEYTAIIRFRFNSIIFLLELIEKINFHKKIDKIFVSGWNSYFAPLSIKNHFISDVIVNLVTDIKVVKLSNTDVEKISSREEKKYIIRNTNINKNKNYILVNTFGYNLIRIILWLSKKNCYVLVPTFDKYLNKKEISFFMRKILKLFKIIVVVFDSNPSKNQNKFLLPDIKFFYKKKDLSSLLSLRKEQELGNLIKLKNICEGIDILFDKFSIKLALTNFTKGHDGYYIEKSKKKNITSICIPHGSLSEYFNEYDKIYKKIIAEAQLNEKSQFIAIQSKIAKDFTDAYKIKHNFIETGNLIFGNSKSSNKKKIIFAVTLKGFENIQYLGVEMYYEFLDNLNLLNNIAEKNNLEFLVKVHPYANTCFDELQDTFKNLKFTKKKIDKVLKHAFVTISFSSTVIEDSLYSKIPVILFDRWKRYKHCKAEENVKKRNSAVYYVNNENDLIDCINTIKESDNISFKEYVFEGNVKSNIENLMKKLLPH